MNVVIIGNGITGITAARHIRKLSNYNITVISSETDHFFSRTALMYIYMGHMKYEHTKPYEDWFWQKNRIQLLKNKVTKVDVDQKRLVFIDGSDIWYDKLIIASGSKPNKFGWPGQDLIGVQGLYSIQDLEEMEKNTQNIKKAVIVGGGLIGIEMAEMLASRNIAVDFLIREKNYWNSVLPKEEADLVSKHIAEHHINLITETELQEITGNESGKVKSIITKDGNEIACDFVGLTVGVSPAIDFIKNSSIETDRGILVNEFLETNIQDIYSAGDCAQFREPKEKHPAVEQLWYTGKMQAEALAKTICGEKTVYKRGVWFNSAKFLDIEYQTYGLMFNKPDANEETFFWKHPVHHVFFRANFSKENQSIIGFNFLGMRFRQEVAEQWIIQKQTISYCITHLDKGFFDPEFFKNHHQDIIEQFKLSYPQLEIKMPKQKRKFMIW